MLHGCEADHPLFADALSAGCESPQADDGLGQVSAGDALAKDPSTLRFAEPMG